ncbi:MAG TPA: DUF4124 domain-containing protein [Burkholderiaceae bacterium]|nr:DUF4124 domain-containing protein [Burkholderiaceae bacterium]
MRIRSVLLAVLVSAAAMPLAAQAGLYKWIDEQGVVNYSDKPPPGAPDAKPLDEANSSLSVVPGLSKEELAFFREGLVQGRADRLQRELEELRAQSMAPPPPVPNYETEPVVYGGYWPYYYNYSRRRFQDFKHPAHVPVKGAPVQKTPPFRSMKLER